MSGFNLLLVLPNTKKSFLGGVSASGKAGFARIGLSYLAALTPKEINVRILDARVDQVDVNIDVDLVGITAFTSEAPSAYEIADRFRERGVKVVMGGVHVSALPDEALQHADSVVIGEAELVWTQLIEDFKKGELKRTYKATRMAELNNMPIPRRELLDYKMYTSFSTLQATRGCPFQCDFCAVTNFFGNKYRCRPVEEIVAEIKMLPDKRIFFLDDNIVGRPRWAKELMTALIPLNLTWGSQGSITIAKNPELLSLYRKSGGRYVFIGFESVSQKSLENMKKGWNKAEDYVTAINKIQDAGIDILGSFIVGHDDDDISSFEVLRDFILKNNIGAPLINILTPFPGTALYARMEAEGRIFDRDWGNYHAGKVVFTPRGMTPEELQNGYHWLLRDVYSYPKVLKRVIRASHDMLGRISLNYNYRRKAMKLPPPAESFLTKLSP